MGRYPIRRRIEAPPEHVFRAFTEPALLADWMDATSVIDVSGPLDAPGSRYTLVIRGPWRFRVDVVRSEPPSLHETLYRGPLGTVVRRVATVDRLVELVSGGASTASVPAPAWPGARPSLNDRR